MGKGLRFLLRLFQHTFETHPEAFRNRLYRGIPFWLGGLPGVWSGVCCNFRRFLGGSTSVYKF